MTQEDAISRRSFATVLAGTGLAAAAAVGTFMTAAFLYPVAKTKKRPLFACLKSDMPEGKPKEIKDPIGRKILLMRDSSGQLIAIGTICSHLGCTVFYRPDKNLFECPCHEGVFDAMGNPVSGPPRTPLARYPVHVKGNKIFVEFA